MKLVGKLGYKGYKEYKKICKTDTTSKLRQKLSFIEP
jgi:hypothetical protein